MPVVDYQYHRLLWSLAGCISSLVIAHQAPQLGVLQLPYDLPLPSPPPLEKDLGLDKSVPQSLFPLLIQVQVEPVCVAHVTSTPSSIVVNQDRKLPESSGREKGRSLNIN